MIYAAFNSGIKDTLEEINAAKDLDLELDPSWTYPIFNSGRPSFGYMIQRSSGELRVLSVAMNVRVFDEELGGGKRLNANAREKFIKAIEAFWSKGNTSSHSFIDVS